VDVLPLFSAACSLARISDKVAIVFSPVNAYVKCLSNDLDCVACATNEKAQTQCSICAFCLCVNVIYVI